MYETNYIRAKNLADATKHLSSASEGKILAGGMTLLPVMKQRLALSDCLVDLSDCGLSGIEDLGDSLSIGAMTCHADVATSAVVRKEIPVLSALAGGIGDRQVRHCGTLGGSLANNDPAACYPAAVLALGGSIHTTERTIPADEYFTGLFETALEEHEIITSVTLPKPKAASYMKHANPASRYAVVGVFVAQLADSSIRVSVTGAGDEGVFRHALLEDALSKGFSVASVDSIEVSSEGLLSDIHASADYRAHLLKVLAGRAVKRAV